MSDSEITSIESTKKLSDLSDKIKQISTNVKNIKKEINNMQEKIYVSEMSKKMIITICSFFLFGFLIFSLLIDKSITLTSFFQILSFSSVLISAPYISSRLLKKKYSSKIVDLTKMVDENLNLEEQLKKEYFKIKTNTLTKEKKNEDKSIDDIPNEYNIESKKLMLVKK